jgi:V-type H+-transporting ATPase subunit d
MLDKLLYEEGGHAARTAEQQFHYGVFFAFMRLAEQETGKLFMWISEASLTPEVADQRRHPP